MQTSATFDISKNVWKTDPGNLKVPRGGSKLLNVNGRILIFGGIPHTNLVEEYNVKTGTWTMLATKLKEPRQSMAAAAVPANLFYHLHGGCLGN